MIDDRRRRLAGLALAVATIGVGACGGGGTTSSTTATTVRASGATSTGATPVVVTDGPGTATPSGGAATSSGTSPLTSASAPTSVSVSASASPSGPAGRDATSTDLRGARVAAACDTGPVVLTDGRAPAGGPASGELTQDLALVDLDGDGAKEAVGVYTCLRSSERPGNAVLVAVRAGGQTLGSVSVGDEAQSAVTSLRPEGRSVVVEWESAESGARPPTRHTGVARWDGAHLVTAETVSSRPARTAASAVVGITEFAAPSGNVLCSMSADGASCTIDRSTFTPPPDPGCDGSWGSSVSVDEGPARFYCKSDAWAASDPTPSWWTAGVDGHAKALGWANAPTLGYGHVLQAGETRCEVKQDSGVTCSRGGHGFTLGRAAYSLR